jgi:putative heme-binding domain-containing protein
MLAELVERGESPLARMHALWALDGLGALAEKDVLAGLNDANAGVRPHAVELAERFVDSTAVRQKLTAMIDDPEPRVRYQLAFTIGQLKALPQATLLSALAKRDGASEWMRAAILSSSADCAGELFEALADDATTVSSPLLMQLASIIGDKHDAKDVARIVHFITTSPNRKQRLAIASALAQRAYEDVNQPLQPVIEEAKKTAFDRQAPAAERVAAIQLLGLVNQTDHLAELLGQPSQMIQLAALSAMDHADAPALTESLLQAWPALSPRVQSDAAGLLIKRPGRAEALLRAIVDGRVKASALTTTQAAFLRKHANATVKELANQALPPPPSRESVIEKFRPALALSGDVDRGHDIYAKRCISCHRAGREGSQVGPDWASFKNTGREKLLLNILDPNREVAAAYVSFLVETKDGQSVLGVPSSDLPSGITIRQAYGRETTIPRSDIEHMISDGKSLMPEGLEEGLSVQDFADLLAFVESAK